ncbi:MAG: transglutaminase domain-containing protein [Bacteroidia bacterium]|nr:transglutaminase domain-containing protein [Bacteroidia bacterium]
MLLPGTFIDSDHPGIVDFARKTVGDLTDPVQKAIKLYYAVRDGWRYDPYDLDLSPAAVKGSHMLSRKHGYCGEKAALLAAAARAVGIPSRLRFANVRNHVGTSRLEERLKTDVLVFHGFNEFFLHGKWVKATPAFNQELCEKLGVEPLEFDGENDSIFQAYDREKGKFMEYLHDYGPFGDVPYELFINELVRNYPHLFVDRMEKIQAYLDQAAQL